jgi:hypothetical protein
MGARAYGAKVLIPALFLVGLVAAATPPVAIRAVAATNPIVTENQQLGTRAWIIGSRQSDDTNGQIKGYTSATSVLQGQPLTFYISVNPAQTYSIDFYRIGYYAGQGGRLLRHVDQPTSPTQPPCGPTAPNTGLLTCNWQPSYTLTPDASWTSGGYVALLTNATGFQNYVPFVVKDGRPAAFLYQAAVSTYQAYNNYPNDAPSPGALPATGKSLYDYNSSCTPTVAGSGCPPGATSGVRAVKVSFDRPYAGRGDGQFFWWEVYFIDWIEQNGYDVTYSTDVDTDLSGAELRNHKAFLSVAHDEYWSMAMFNAAAGARDAGVNLGFFTANAAYWQIRFESSGSNVADRVMVCYKNASIDPVQGPTTTVNFRSAPVNMPEQTLEGVQFTGNVAFAGAVNYVVTNSSHWVYAGTGFHDGDSVPGIVGYEMDRLFPNPPYPAPIGNQVLLSHSPYTDVNSGLPDYANSSIYQAPSGALVFAAGSIEWSLGLYNEPWDNPGVANARIQQTTANVLNAFINGAPVAKTLKVTAAVSATAGQGFTTTVAAINAQGNPATAYGGTVHFTSSDPAAVLPADYTFTTGTVADNGTHQFQVTLKTSGPQTVTATDTGTGSVTGSTTVTVGSAAASSLTLTGLTGATAGTPQTATVTARDAFGNIATGHGGTVAFTSSDGQASLPANYTFVPADGGVRLFSGGVTLRTSGTQTVTVTDTTNAALTSSQAVSITPSVAAASLSVTGLTNATAGTAQTVTVTARNSTGGVVPGYTGTVAFTSSDAQASLPANYTFVPADNGAHTFVGGVTLKTAGTQTVTATDTGTSSVTGNQSVTISAGPLASLALSPPSATVTAGGSQGYTATGADQYGNSLGDLTAGTTFSIGPNGTCTAASCTATTAGAHTVTGTNSGTTATASLTITPGPLNQLAISPTSATITAGGSQGYTATGSDQYGNSLGDLTAGTTFTVAPNGSCTGSSCTATVAGAHTVTGSNSGKTATASLNVVAAAASKLSLTAPSSAKMAQSFQVTVTLTDQYGNVATGYRGTVRFTSSDMLASLDLIGNTPANYTFTSADAGTHSFGVTLMTVGNQTITAADTGNGSLSDTKTVAVSLM